MGTSKKMKWMVFLRSNAELGWVQSGLIWLFLYEPCPRCRIDRSACCLQSSSLPLSYGYKMYGQARWRFYSTGFDKELQTFSQRNNYKIPSIRQKERHMPVTQCIHNQLTQSTVIRIHGEHTISFHHFFYELSAF